MQISVFWADIYVARQQPHLNIFKATPENRCWSDTIFSLWEKFLSFDSKSFHSKLLHTFIVNFSLYTSVFTDFYLLFLRRSLK